MYHMNGRIRDYDGTSDTASVEIDGNGIIESWLDSVRLSPGINRAFCVHGNICTLAVPDRMRLTEATVVGLGDTPGTPSLVTAGAKQITQSGRAYVATDNAGNTGSVTINFPTSFSAQPQVSALADNRTQPTISSVTTTSFTLTATGVANSNVGIAWQAQGNA